MRKHVKHQCIGDLCCGHGFTGILFAVFERRVEHVPLIDAKRPVAFDAILEATAAVAPWACEKVSFIEAPLRCYPGP